MYTLPSKLKLFAIVFMVIGAIGMVTGFLNAPKTTAEVKEMMASGHGDHGDDHNVEAGHNGGHDAVEDAHDDEAHYEHVLHQMQNRPWSAIYIASFFFFMISLGVLAFYAIQYASQAGWSPVLFRVMEAITAYLPWASVIILVLLSLSAMDINHIFHWMDAELLNPESDKYDKLIDGKSGWLNKTGFLIRAAVYLLGWNLYRHFSRKFSVLDDTAEDNRYFKKNFRIAAGFLVFFIYTESMMSWDWLMSFDPHWFSTLYGWYIFAGMMVCGITVIALITIILKAQGYLEFVNDSHIHDLAKFMFAFSIFWTYLWFSQFMLIWYSNIPEEVTYYITRIEHFKWLFFGIFFTNFLFPMVILIARDAKRQVGYLITVGVIIFVGHWLDVYMMIVPGSLGHLHFGFMEIGMFLGFLGLFLYVVFNSFSKAPMTVKNHPFLDESKHLHI